MRHHSKKTAMSPVNVNKLSLKIILSLTLVLTMILTDKSVPAQASQAEMTEVERVALMEEHYTAAILGHDALIQGDLKMLRSQLSRIAKQELPPSAPQSWKPHHSKLHKAASNADKISDLETAASVIADIAEACGSCHAALKAKYMYYWPSPPDEDEKHKTTMHTHQWATERLWEGVTAPFKPAWDRGASALAEVQIFGGDNEKVKSSLRKLETDLREIGRTANTTAGLHKQAKVYGQLLTTCAQCHKEAGITIKPAKELPPWQK